MHSQNNVYIEKIATIPTIGNFSRFHLNNYATKWISSIPKSYLAYPIVIMCIGSDKHVVDSYGPLVGTLLQQVDDNWIIFGTLDNPVTSFNIENSIKVAKRFYPDSLIICLDAAVSRTPKIGNIEIFRGPLKPGDALGKKFTPIGDYHIKGYVNYSEVSHDTHFMNDTRLAVVYRMAQVTVYLLTLLKEKIPQID